MILRFLFKEVYLTKFENWGKMSSGKMTFGEKCLSQKYYKKKWGKTSVGEFFLRRCISQNLKSGEKCRLEKCLLGKNVLVKNIMRKNWENVLLGKMSWGITSFGGKRLAPIVWQGLFHRLHIFNKSKTLRMVCMECKPQSKIFWLSCKHCVQTY